ncbi:MAG TPA: cation:proton antiporter [Mycobacterium sp.]|uniref:cation:proton antiporter n=1 Tax=Mycobacterium sp. TaxID=1785 RepID=UPI002B81A0F2|nr:cation:proton antiporter [Mycobacterium sp.]HXO80408.1 cation:proton antiporter [Mycobacterium sp.]
MPLGNVLQALIVLAVVLVGSVFIGNLFRRIRQPAVVGVIFFGLLLGTILAISPHSVNSALLSPTSKSLIDAVGQAGLLLLLFLVGVELRSYSKTTTERSPLWRLLPCVLIPVIVCAAAAFPFAHRLVGPDHNPMHVWMFIGVALSVTAVPVLVLIMKDLAVAAPIPGVALRIAVATDAAAWALVTVLILVTRDLSTVSVPALCVGAGLLITVMFVLPRIVERLFRDSHQGAPFVVAVFAYVLAGAAATQVFGLHPALGAVLAGLFFPAGLANEASQRALGAVADILIPAFFVSSALSVPLQVLADLFRWGSLVCLLVLTMAAFGSKLAVGLVAGRMQRWPLATSAKLGVLLNCRGVTELAIASIGLQAHLIGPYAFAMLCALAIVTTAVTAPLYRAINNVTRTRAHTETSRTEVELAA